MSSRSTARSKARSLLARTPLPSACPLQRLEVLVRSLLQVQSVRPVTSRGGEERVVQMSGKTFEIVMAWGREISNEPGPNQVIDGLSSMSSPKKISNRTFDRAPRWIAFTSKTGLAASTSPRTGDGRADSHVRPD